MNKWQVNIKIWQVNIKIWQDDIKIWQGNIIIWQVMAEVCHHTVYTYRERKTCLLTIGYFDGPTPRHQQYGQCNGIFICSFIRLRSYENKYYTYFVWIYFTLATDLFWCAVCIIAKPSCSYVKMWIHISH